MRFADGQAEHAQPRHLGDDLVGDQLIAQVPVVCGGGMVVGEARELLAHLVQRGIVVARVAEARVVAAPSPTNAAMRWRAAGAKPSARRRRTAASALKAAQRSAIAVQRIGAEELALAHRQAAGQLRQVFAEGRAQQQRFQLAEPAGRLQPLRPGQHLLQRAHVGRGPGHAVGARLFELQRAGLVGIGLLQRCAQRGHQLAQQGFGGLQRLLGSRPGSGRDRSCSILRGSCLPPAARAAPRRPAPAAAAAPAACVRPGAARGRARAVRVAPKCSGEVAVRKRPTPGCSVRRNIGLASEQRGSSASICSKLRYGPHSSERSVKAALTSASVRAANHGPQRGGDQPASGVARRPRCRARGPAPRRPRAARPAARWRAAARSIAGR